MKMVCEQNKGEYVTHNLTIGKVYDILFESDFFYYLFDDRGSHDWVRKSDFITLESYRDKQIEELL